MRYAEISKELNDLSYQVINSAYKVHNLLGPGLLEKCYIECLFIEFKLKNIQVQKQVPISIIYNEHEISNAYRIDLLIDEKIIIEVKSIDGLAPIHEAQLLTYLTLSNKRLGFLMNFNEKHLRAGIKRMVK